MALIGAGRASGVALPVSVADMVRYSFIGDPDVYYAGDIDTGYNLGQLVYEDADTASFSPDARYFAVIVRHGDLSDDETKASVEVFETTPVFGGKIKPTLAASFASSGARPPIYAVRWTADSQHVFFIADKPNAAPQVYAADLKSGSVRRVTGTEHGVVKFDVTPNGSALALLVPVGDSACGGSDYGRRHGYRIAVDGIIDALTGSCELAFLRQSEHLYVQRGGGPASRIPDPGRIAFLGGGTAEFSIEKCYALFGGVSISPDGRYAVRTCAIAAVPSRWSEFDSTGRSDVTEMQKVLQFPLHQELLGKSNVATLDNLLVQQDVIFDLSTGRAVLAWDSPLIPATADMSRPRAWLGEAGHRLVLAGVLVRENGGGWGSHGQFGPAVVEVDPATGSRRMVLEKGAGVAGVEWSSRLGGLVVDYGLDPTDLRPNVQQRSQLFQLKKGRWAAARSVTDDQVRGSDVHVKLAQTLNEWPKLVATRSGSPREVTVLDPNGWLKDRALARERRFRWSSHGYTFEGGLYFPLGYSRHTRYPLVIQTHGFGPWFSLYGEDSSGSAAQPPAAQGFFVAQLGRVIAEPRSGKIQNSRKLFWIEAQSLISELTRRKMIDTTRLGITGWSSYWLSVENMLTFSGVRFAAAVDGDGWDGGYFIYTATDDSRGLGDREWGGPPTKRGLRHWLDVVPDFNLERMHAPLLVLAPGQIGLQGNWEVFSRLRQLGKPVEMFYMPTGTHEIIQPWYWAASAQRVVDWYRFWLKGEEDNSPGKRDQYRQWEGYCAEARQQMAGSPAELHCPDGRRARLGAQ